MSRWLWQGSTKGMKWLGPVSLCLAMNVCDGNTFLRPFSDVAVRYLLNRAQILWQPRWGADQGGCRGRRCKGRGGYAMLGLFLWPCLLVSRAQKASLLPCNSSSSPILHHVGKSYHNLFRRWKSPRALQEIIISKHEPDCLASLFQLFSIAIGQLLSLILKVIHQIECAIPRTLLGFVMTFWTSISFASIVMLCCQLS